MSRTQRFRPTGAAVVTSAVIGAIALAGCGAGQITQTSSQVPAVAGANAGTGQIVVRDAQIEFAGDAEGANIYPVGGAAPLRMSIVNTGGEPDRLVSASSPAAASVEISGSADIPGGRVLLVEGEPAAAPATPTPTAAPAPGGPAAPAPSAEPAPSSDPLAGDAIGGSGQESEAPRPSGPAPRTPAADGPAEATEGAQLVLTGLKEDIRAGLTYPLVLNFERAGQITVTVPVGYPEEPREDAPAE